MYAEAIYARQIISYFFASRRKLGALQMVPVWYASHLTEHDIIVRHGRLARWRKWRASDVGEAKEELENELWCRWSNGRVGVWAVTYVKRRKGWRMSCDLGEVTERLENELCSTVYSSAHSPKLSVTSPTSQLISPTLPSLYLRHNSLSSSSVVHLRHSSFSNLSFACPTSQAIHLRHLASRPCFLRM